MRVILEFPENDPWSYWTKSKEVEAGKQQSSYRKRAKGDQEKREGKYDSPLTACPPLAAVDLCF